MFSFFPKPLLRLHWTNVHESETADNVERGSYVPGVFLRNVSSKCDCVSFPSPFNPLLTRSSLRFLLVTLHSVSVT